MPLTRRFYISATSFQAFTEKGHRHSYARILAYKHMHTCTHTQTRTTEAVLRKCSKK